MFKRRRGRIQRIKLASVLIRLSLPIFLISLFIVLWRLKVFNVKRVVAEGCEATSCNDVASQIKGAIFGRIIFFVSLSKIEEDILKTGNYSSVIAEKVLPSTIRIKLKEVSVKACLYNDRQEVQLDEKGNKVNLFSTCPEGVDRFRYSAEDLELVNTFDLSQIETVKLIKEYMLSKAMSLKEIEISPYGVIKVYLAPNLTGIFSARSDRTISSQLSLFYEVYNFISREDRPISSIDVRFDKVVVKYAQ